MTEINLDSSTLQATRNFLIQYLRDSGYEGSTEDGTAIHDTVIKPVALLLDLFKQQTAKAKAYLSLAEAEALKDSLGDEYDSVVDSILSNWFVERREGDAPKVKVRLFYSSAPDVVTLSKDAAILTIQGVPFFPMEDKLVFRTDFVAHLNPYGGTEKYSIDVMLAAAKGEVVGSTIASSSLSFSLPSRFFVSGEILSEVSKGTTQEATEAFVARTKKAITTREMITDRAISTVLNDAFDEVTATYVAGYGSPEQLRDIHTFQGVTVHTGNKADIYVKTKVERSVKSLVVQDGGYVDLSGTDTLRVLAVRTEGGGILEYSVVSHVEDKVGSLACTLVLNIPSAEAGGTVLVEVLRSEALILPTEFVAHKDNRVGCYDPLVKEMFPIVWSGEVRVQFYPDSLITNTPEALLLSIEETLAKYINGLGVEDGLIVSTLISHLHTQHPEIKRVNTPLTLHYSIEDPANTALVEGDTSSAFTLPSGLSQQVTHSTVQFYTDATLINIIREL